MINDSTLYVSSGFEMEIHKIDGKYVLERLTIDGQELDKTQPYSVAVLGNEVVTLTAYITLRNCKKITLCRWILKQVKCKVIFLQFLK